MIQDPKFHNSAALSLRRDNARFNFRNSSHLIPRATSISHQEIKTTAQQAARDFRSAFSSMADDSGEKVLEGDEVVEFVDEEAIFNVPALIDGMAEGMLLTPPALKRGFNWSEVGEDDDHVDLNLWEF